MDEKYIKEFIRKRGILRMKITKKDFREYEGCRQRGNTNMLHISNVRVLTGLSREKILYIIKNYNDLYKKYMEGK